MAGLVFLLAGCASYHSEPISEELPQVGWADVRVQANAFSHPLLKPVVFDERDGLSADEAAILAVLANPELRVARDRRGVASAQLLQAGILPNPTLSAGFEVPTGGNASDTVNSYGLGLDWEVTALLARNAQKEAAAAHAGSVDLEIAWQEWQVAEAARLHYYRLGFAEKRLALAQQMEDSAGRLRDDTQRGVALGIRTQTELSAAETSVQETGANVINAQSMAEQERQALNRVLGLATKAALIPAPASRLQITDEVPSEELFAGAVTNRLDLQALRLGYESQEANVRAAVRAGFPKISLGLTGGRDTDNVQTLGAGIGIELPFFDRNQGHIAEQRATRKQLADEYHARLFETRADLERLAVAITTARRQRDGIDQLLPALEAQADSLQRAEEAGRADVFAVRAAESALLGKKAERLDLEQQVMELGLALELASGHYGWVEEKQ